MGEIELLRNLHHPNIVEYIGSFKTRTHLYIIMEFMENGALSSVIKPNKFGTFPEPLAAAYISQVITRPPGASTVPWLTYASGMPSASHHSLVPFCWN